MQWHMLAHKCLPATLFVDTRRNIKLPSCLDTSFSSCSRLGYSHFKQWFLQGLLVCYHVYYIYCQKVPSSGLCNDHMHRAKPFTVSYALIKSIRLPQYQFMLVELFKQIGAVSPHGCMSKVTSDVILSCHSRVVATDHHDTLPHTHKYYLMLYPYKLYAH